MAAPVFIGDEVTATAYRLAGVATRVPGFGEVPRVFDAVPVRFGCTCSEDRVRQTLSIYSAKDIATMTTGSGTVTADCQFCGAHYEFDPATLGFEAERDPDDGHSGDQGKGAGGDD